uniref:Uncharacterized protein n=1 Tax=Raphanus sativus TaxID=3726 RepID=C4WRH4_RAPSA|nr:hypothetical protein [Raphanus sativus]
MRGGASGNNVLETINAAATAFASSDDRVHHQPSPIHRRKRIGKAALAPEPVPTDSTSNSGYRSVMTALPFIAPPSSPASFFQSEPPSATQSPVGILSFSPLPSNSHNNNNNSEERPSIFAIGPYAHEPQLVSPPVFSTYTTEPSSAPVTPPLDESFYLTTTTPSSPEVPFAQLFNSSSNYGVRSPVSNYEFQFYQLPPGSPLAQLISPSSVMSGSGATSPFPDGLAQFQVSDPPKLLSPGKLRCSKSVTTPKEQNKIVRPNKPVSFDLDADHFIRCVDKKLRTTFPEASDQEAAQHSSSGSNKEFDFGTTDEIHLTGDDEHRDSTKNSSDWSFPVMQSGTLS